MTEPKDDLEHLRLLSIFHYVVAALGALFALLPLLHVAFGVVIVSGALRHERNPPPAAMGWFFIVLGGTLTAIGLACAVLVAIAGRNLARRRSYTFCFVIAALLCCFAPAGTVLGVFTLIVLLRPSVKALFAQGASAVR